MHANDLSVTDVTAELAEEWLKENVGNRRLRMFTVEKYAADMVAGRWMLSTDVIGFDTTGRLIQGQHRLMAVIVANEQKPGISVPMLIGFGFPPGSFDVLDQGTIRGVGTVLGTHGVTNVNIVAATARQLLFYDKFPNNIWRGNESISRVEVLDFAMENREMLHEAQAIPYGVGMRSVFNRTSMTVLHFLVMRDSANADRWDEWMRAVSHGENLPPGHAALVLRNGEILAKWGLGGAQPRLGAYIKLWNYFIEGRTTRGLLFRRNELPMPKVT
jgi:hypothetical protein